jgi:2-polyprenyl-3-methyl-5-hydroxy-6-metoxy-1,4-benzoquinol methylase
MRSFLWNLYARFFERFTRLLPYQRLLDEVVSELSLRPSLSVLDAGCGPGALTHRLWKACPTARVVAMDLSSAMLRLARTRHAWPETFRFQLTDLDTGLDATQDSFDRIACINVLWALPAPGATLARMAARLSPGGTLILVTPRARFRADRIVWDHVAGSKGWDRLRALATLPMLAVGGLLNLLLVGTSLLSSRKRSDANRFSLAGVARLCEEAGLSVREARPCYADQAFLFRATVEHNQASHPG